MSGDDTWKSGETADTGTSGDFGTPAYGTGAESNAAFSIDVVFRYGLQILQEQPAMALLGGLNFFGLTFLTGMVGGVAQLAVAGMVVGGDLDQQVADALGQLTSAMVQLVAYPFNQLVLAGLMVAGAHYARSGEANIGMLYTSVGPAVRAMVAGIVAGLGSLVVLVLCMIPAGLAVGVLASGGSEITTTLGVGLLLFLPALPVLVWVGLGLMFAPYAAALDDLGPIDAIQRSWEAASGARITLFVTNFSFGVLGILSACLCSFPLIALMPIQVMGFAAAWLRYARSTEETDGWPFFRVGN